MPEIIRFTGQPSWDWQVTQKLDVVVFDAVIRFDDGRVRQIRMEAPPDRCVFTDPAEAVDSSLMEPRKDAG